MFDSNSGRKVSNFEGLQNSYAAEFRILYTCLYQAVNQQRETRSLLNLQIRYPNLKYNYNNQTQL